MGFMDFLIGTSGDEQAKRTLAMLMSELDGSSPSALSALERGNLLAKREGGIRKRAETQSARTSASLKRRGVTSPGILTKAMTDIGTQAQGDINMAESDIMTHSLNLGRNKEDMLMRLVAMLSQSKPDQPGFLQGLLGAGSQALGTYLGNRPLTAAIRGM